MVSVLLGVHLAGGTRPSAELGPLDRAVNEGSPLNLKWRVFSSCAALCFALADQLVRAGLCCCSRRERHL